MSATTATLVHRWKVGTRYSVTLTVPTIAPGSAMCAICEWDPHYPARLTADEHKDYTAGVHAVTARLADLLEGKK